MGDGIMALFGVDGAPDALLRAVRAGLGISMRWTRRSSRTSLPPTAGASTSASVYTTARWSSGRWGRGRRQESPRSVTPGGAVNFASRIESAKMLAGTRMLISDETSETVRDRVRTGRTCCLPVKGKSGEVHAARGDGPDRGPAMRHARSVRVATGWGRR